MASLKAEILTLLFGQKCTATRVGWKNKQNDHANLLVTYLNSFEKTNRVKTSGLIFAL